jgi:hypothetical protein
MTAHVFRDTDDVTSLVSGKTSRQTLEVLSAEKPRICKKR